MGVIRTNDPSAKQGILGKELHLLKTVSTEAKIGPKNSSAVLEVMSHSARFRNCFFPQIALAIGGSYFKYRGEASQIFLGGRPCWYNFKRSVASPTLLDWIIQNKKPNLKNEGLDPASRQQQLRSMFSILRGFRVFFHGPGPSNDTVSHLLEPWRNDGIQGDKTSYPICSIWNIYLHEKP